MKSSIWIYAHNKYVHCVLTLNLTIRPSTIELNKVPGQYKKLPAIENSVIYSNTGTPPYSQQVIHILKLRRVTHLCGSLTA